ncbi:MAG: 23S rRNA (pseudouridine(1915)-N(3))-methyltransferase RlmH [Ruminococcus sp.]|uniref:23S rRNA (pseudouridine(1915)-N(3))-methyltransferase RlmH n=1 Tax=Ruminococcus sp. TaxID=41978 RepID=UPI0025D3E525|nr:23S rRNA (pseudouridine(1915)-N(3))-methyltransferase RlmH [Ruminococcus sp.]MCR5600479.1 23S rRNA (pseudouridine(1915)-N(3))-methyltransferase RlmH [Ruminococcus sp.]
MMNINLIVIGKLKEEYLRSACAEYIKRLGRYCTFELHELDECRLSDSPSDKEISAALKKEADQIKKYAKGMIVPMCIEGKQLTSPELSEKITSAGVSGQSTVTFIIGSSFGLDPEIKAMGALKLSMSKMTFPHQLARVMLLEQIYRAFQIAEGGKYHK